MITIDGITYWTVAEISKKSGRTRERVYGWINAGLRGDHLAAVEIIGKLYVADEEWRRFSEPRPKNVPVQPVSRFQESRASREAGVRVRKMLGMEPLN